MTAAVTAIHDDVDVVLGHHQHRLQPMEQIGDSVVFWGLGNFVWPRNSAASADTAVATIVSAGHPTLDDPEQTTC